MFLNFRSVNQCLDDVANLLIKNISIRDFYAFFFVSTLVVINFALLISINSFLFKVMNMLQNCLFCFMLRKDSFERKLSNFFRFEKYHTF